MYFRYSKIKCEKSGISRNISLSKWQPSGLNASESREVDLELLNTFETAFFNTAHSNNFHPIDLKF